MIIDLKQQRAFVTGGAKGIGEAIVAAFAANGADVVFADIDTEAAAKVAGATGAKACAVDLTDLRLTYATVLREGPFDILVNNAGVDQHTFFTDTDMTDWRFLLSINLEAVFATTLAALPAMRERGRGRIINIASEAGRMGSRGGSVYAAAKGGVIAFTKSIARENARNGITANVIAPGPIDTPMVRAAAARLGDKIYQTMQRLTQLNRLGKPEEVAAAALFLASEQSAFITGEVLGVSGGMGCGQ